MQGSQGGAVNTASRARTTTAPPAFILIVDDEYLGRVVISDELLELGYAVLEAASGDEAAEMLDVFPVDMVITDLRMPGGLDGGKLADLLDEAFPAVPVLLMSADVPDPEVLKRVDGFFEKPVPVAKLRAEVSALLDAGVYEGSNAASGVAAGEPSLHEKG